MTFVPPGAPITVPAWVLADLVVAVDVRAGPKEVSGALREARKLLLQTYRAFANKEARE